MLLAMLTQSYMLQWLLRVSNNEEEPHLGCSSPCTVNFCNGMKVGDEQKLDLCAGLCVRLGQGGRSVTGGDHVRQWGA